MPPFEGLSRELGYKIDAHGLHTTTQKVKAIQQAPRPVNQHQLQSFLGLLQYYGKFIPNLSTLPNTMCKKICSFDI